MKKDPTFECVECGYQSLKYFGRCPQCQNWNSLVEKEESEEEQTSSESTAKLLRLNEIDPSESRRLTTGIEEFDRLLGGGIVSDSVILIGGEPGVGKSTLLLQISSRLESQKLGILYYSGEESASQIKLRAMRLEVASDSLYLLTGGTMEDLLSQVQKIKPKVLIIDSIQTLYSHKTMHNSGSPSALRFLTSQIIETAKTRGITVFIVGHITKEGQLAGPKTLEHMVDVVLYFQGDLQQDVRILRAEKNRFGSVNEIGIFRMGEKGLVSVADLSQIFIQHRHTSEPGIALFPAVNGQRTMVIEIQALVTDSPFAANPRRIAIGFDSYKLALIISIIEKKLKFPFYKSDVFLNITGGLAVRDTAADLAVCAALISSFKNIPIPSESVFIGEIGLTGEIRPVSMIEIRMRESARQGFQNAYIPASQNGGSTDLNTIGLENISKLLQALKGESNV